MLAVTAPAEARQTGDPAADQQGAAMLEELGFLAGCWSGVMGSLEVREQWTEAEGGMMMWTTRFLRDGQIADFEFGMLLADSAGTTLWPYPRGERSEHGFPLVRSEDEYVFENLEHDFPVRIVYVRDGENGLNPRIEGRDGEARGWSLTRVRCPEGD
jgi:hypothetical protein